MSWRNQFEALVVQQMIYVTSSPGKEVIGAEETGAFAEQSLTKMRHKKSSSSCHHNASLIMHLPVLAKASYYNFGIVGTRRNYVTQFDGAG